MEAKKTHAGMAYSTMAFAIFIACLLLFSLDEEVHSLTNLFELGNLIALLLYGIPTFVISALLYSKLSTKYSIKGSITRSLAIGIPLTFTLVIVTLLLIKR